MTGATTAIVQLGSSSDLFTGLVGVFGAVLGSIVAVVGAEFATSRRYKRDNIERRTSIAFSIYQKLTFIYSDSMTMRRTLMQGVLEHAVAATNILKRGIEVDENGAIIVRPNFLSSHVQSWANPPGEVQFSTDETWLAKDISGVDLLNELMIVDRKFNSLMRSYVVYSAERKAMQALIRVDAVDGASVTMSGPPAEFLQYHASANALDEMVMTMHEMAEEVVEEAFEAIKLLIECEKRPFGDGAFEIKGPHGDTVVLGGPQDTAAAPPRSAAYR